MGRITRHYEGTWVRTESFDEVWPPKRSGSWVHWEHFRLQKSSRERMGGAGASPFLELLAILSKLTLKSSTRGGGHRDRCTVVAI